MNNDTQLFCHLHSICQVFWLMKIINLFTKVSIDVPHSFGHMLLMSNCHMQAGTTTITAKIFERLPRHYEKKYRLLNIMMSFVKYALKNRISR